LKQSFFVLYIPSEGKFYVDTPAGFGYTLNLLSAERFETFDDAEKYRNYFKKPEEFTIKEVTVSVEL
jgi:hypothetical protein